MIRFEQLQKKYGKHVVLKELSSSIPQGKITSLIGPNGAGKSTLLSIVSRLLKQDSGRVFFYERELSAYNNNDLAKQLSILKQSNHMDVRLTVKDMVSFGRFPHAKGRLTRSDWEKVKEALRFAELSELQDAYIDELSGGQRQRAFIAMIIAQDTEYILLDEPLNNLDMRHSVQVMKMLRKLVDELGKTIIIVIHEINFAAQFSDHIIAMKNGHICYNDHVDAVITADVLEEIFEIKFDIIQQNGCRICNYFNV
ncbi:MAG TPA: ATP-binding cassette domain-containing protein [Sphingobacterium sp.]|nr:ATP-binding cassette domain-containing protein [Sphingobacterium sp.]